jgi:predicted acyl esterase
MNTITEHNVDVPVRDGTLLRANIFRTDDDLPHPRILLRTPYSKLTEGFERGFAGSGYAVITQARRPRAARVAFLGGDPGL